MAAAAKSEAHAPHIPVLLPAILKAVAPVEGVWLDGTFGAGGYTRGLLDAGAARVIAVDRDPLAFELAAGWAADYGDRLVQRHGTFSRMDEFASDLDGVVLDLGVSSMQLDDAALASLVEPGGECIFNWTNAQGYPVGVVVEGAVQALLDDRLGHDHGAHQGGHQGQQGRETAVQQALPGQGKSHHGSAPYPVPGCAIDLGQVDGTVEERS